MTDLLKLSAEWRLYHATQKGLVPQARYHIEACADQIDAALPVWTKITDNPDTWPDDDGVTILFAEWLNNKWIVDTWDGSHMQGVTGLYWRPLCSIDTPPQEGDL